MYANTASVPKLNPKAASTSCMVVGADVSHPAPGAGSDQAASFAAITVSADPYFAKYWADVQTNGNRVEMITSSNIHDHFGPMAKNWMQRVGQGKAPERVLYIRDGVSEAGPSFLIYLDNMLTASRVNTPQYLRKKFAT